MQYNFTDHVLIILWKHSFCMIRYILLKWW